MPVITGAFSSPELAKAVVDNSEQYAERFKQAFLVALASLRGLEAVNKVIENIDRGIAMIEKSDEITGMGDSVSDAIENVSVDPEGILEAQWESLVSAGSVTADEVGLGISFDITNPRAIQAAQNIGIFLVTYVNDSVRASIRDIIQNQVSGLIGRAEAHRLIKQRVGLLPNHALAVQNLEASLTTSGMLSPTLVANRVQAYAARLLKYRADMISRTEVARATSVGQHEYWEQAADAGLLPPNTLRKWIVTRDERLCDICEPMTDSDAIPLDGYWELDNGEQVFYPTDSHPSCRCTTGLVFPDLLGKADPLGWERWIAIRPIQKHAQHDQKSHGSWARGGQQVYAGWSRSAPGIYDLYYGDHEWEHTDPWEPEFDYTSWASYDGNYVMRKASAAMMKLDSPPAEDGGYFYLVSPIKDWLDNGGAYDVKLMGYPDDLRTVQGQMMSAFAAVNEISSQRYDPGQAITRKLYRGLSDIDPDSTILTGEIGSTYTIPLSAFSPDIQLASQFAKGQNDRPEVLITVRPGTHVVGGDDSYLSSFQDPDTGSWVDDHLAEYVTAGEFRIVSREKVRVEHRPPGGKITQFDRWDVTVEQVGVYDPDYGRIVDIDRDNDGWVHEGTDEEQYIGKAKSKMVEDWVWAMSGSLLGTPIQKHAQHDQKSHGNWATGGAKEYRGQHSPPYDAPPLHDLLAEGSFFPDDVYTHSQFYAYGDRDVVAESLAVIRSVRGNPDALVTVYRSVPPGVTDINTGDWVSLSRSYAEQHGAEKDREYWDADLEWTHEYGDHKSSGVGQWVQHDPPRDWPVIEAKVPARLIHNGGNDLIEWGYWGPSAKDGGTISKHAQHDQKSHGSWARGTMSDSAQEAAMRWSGMIQAESWDALGNYGKVLTEAGRPQKQPWDSPERKDAIALTEALREAPASESSVYRGVQADPGWKQGDVLELPLRAVTHDHGVAEKYARDFESGGFDRAAGTIIEFSAGTPIIDLENLGGSSYEEAITGGIFKVVDATYGTTFSGGSYPWYELEFVKALPPMKVAGISKHQTPGHGPNDQKVHGSWARTGSATPKEMREEFMGRLPTLGGYTLVDGYGEASSYGRTMLLDPRHRGIAFNLGNEATAQQEWEDGYLDEGYGRGRGWWTNIGAWHQRMLSAALLNLGVPEALAYEEVYGWSPGDAELVIQGELSDDAVVRGLTESYGHPDNWAEMTNVEAEFVTEANDMLKDQLPRAWKALAAAGVNPPIDYPLRRVIQNLNPGSEMLNLKPGDTYFAPLGSYSAFTGMAHDFLNRGRGDDRPEVVLTVKPGARGVTYDGVGRGEFSMGNVLPSEEGGPLEAVLAGKFQVTEVRVATDGTRHIEVAQVEIPNMDHRARSRFATAGASYEERDRSAIMSGLPRDADGDGIIYEGTDREMRSPLVAPVEKGGSGRVPLWFFEDFAPAEPHSISKHQTPGHGPNDQKVHGSWARGKKAYQQRLYGELEEEYGVKLTSSQLELMGLPSSASSFVKKVKKEHHVTVPMSEEQFLASYGLRDSGYTVDGGEKVVQASDPDDGYLLIYEKDGSTVVLYESKFDLIAGRLDLEGIATEYSVPEWRQEYVGGVVYHGTTNTNVASIAQDGLESRNDTRGMANRHIGDAVFLSATPGYSMGYGEVLIEVDLDRLFADGVLSVDDTFPEPDVLERQIVQDIAYEFNEYDYTADYGSGPLPVTTIVLEGSHIVIPPEYMTVNGQPIKEFVAPDEVGKADPKRRPKKRSKRAESLRERYARVRLICRGTNVSKHADHDQKSHGNWARGTKPSLTSRMTGDNWDNEKLPNSYRGTYRQADSESKKAGGNGVVPAKVGEASRKFTEKAGELPGMAIVRSPEGDYKAVQIGISTKGLGPMEGVVSDRMRKHILDSLNRFSPEFRPTVVEISLAGAVGGGFHELNQEVMVNNSIGVSVWALPHVLTDDIVLRVVNDDDAFGHAILSKHLSHSDPDKALDQYRRYINELHRRPTAKAYANLEKIVLHEGAHAAEDKMWKMAEVVASEAVQAEFKRLSDLGKPMAVPRELPGDRYHEWREDVTSAWQKDTEVFFDEHFKHIGNLDVAGASRPRHNTKDEFYYLAATQRMGGTTLGRKLEQSQDSDWSVAGRVDARADAELFAEYIRLDMQGIPFPNGDQLTEFLGSVPIGNFVRDGDGDGFIFDGTSKERSA